MAKCHWLFFRHCHEQLDRLEANGDAPTRNMVRPLRRTGTFPAHPLSVSSLAVVCNNSLETANLKSVSLTTHFRAAEEKGAEPAVVVGLRRLPAPGFLPLISVPRSCWLVWWPLAHPGLSTPSHHCCQPHRCTPCPHYNSHLHVSRTEAFFSFFSPRNHILGQEAGKAKALL